ncbi:MAG: hypothetical protein ACPGSC_13790, partial [Granulosicoccaceae bacterium]
MRFIVKVSSETFIKSKSVRSWHMKQLRRNIDKVLKAIDPSASVRSLWDRMEVNCAQEHVDACRNRLCDIPGISHILTVETFEIPAENPLVFMAEKCVQFHAQALQGKTFAVRCKREGIHPF